ncbi:MAG: type II secretion system F family protein [Natronomonas sp.]
MRSLTAIDRGLFALFSRHADDRRHDIDRRHYRGAALSVGFDTYLARVYGLSWLVATAVGCLVGTVVVALPAETASATVQTLHAATPVLNRLSLPSVSRPVVATTAGFVAFVFGKRSTIVAAGAYLRFRADARRSNIERTLPGAVRYLRALADGSDDRRTMLRKVAEQDAYGETSRGFRRVLQKTTVTGSLGDGIRETARETPSRELFAPFLLKFQEHANQGTESLSTYLRMESRMLSHRQRRSRQRAGDFLELLAELFVVLLVLPALLVIILTVMSILSPGLSAPTPLPGNPSIRAVVVYSSAAFVLVVGLIASALVVELRPPNHTRRYVRPKGIETLRTAFINPASASAVGVVPATAAGLLLWRLGYEPLNVLLLCYAAYGIPVGVVAVRRARLDDAKDREIRDFIHAVAGHVSLGRPFSVATETVAREVDFGALQDDVEDLAFTLGLTTGPDADVRQAALDQFVERIGTPLAEQSVGLVTGALDVGSDAETTFETLQTEIGRLYHAKKKLRSSMLVYVAVGWTTALLVVAIVVAVNTHVLSGFEQLSSVSRDAVAVIDPEAVDADRDAWRFYVVTQATMLSCGWFAGVASRGRYEALLHSGLLVVVCYAVFAGAGVV